MTCCSHRNIDAMLSLYYDKASDGLQSVFTTGPTGPLPHILLTYKYKERADHLSAIDYRKDKIIYYYKHDEENHWFGRDLKSITRQVTYNTKGEIIEDLRAADYSEQDFEPMPILNIY